MSRKGNNKSQPGTEGIQTRGPQSNQVSQPQAADRKGTQEMYAGGGNGQSEDSNQAFSSDEIAQRAYQIFEREGRTDGRDMDHWLQAEQELRREREQRTGGMNPENAPRSARQHQRTS